MTGKAFGGTSRKFGGVRAEVCGRGPRLLRSCLGVEISIQNPSEANVLEVCLGTPQTSKKSLQKQFHGEAGPSTVLDSEAIFVVILLALRDFESLRFEIPVF